jgi:hypothetical protein
MAMDDISALIKAFTDQMSAESLLAQRGRQALDLAPIQSDLDRVNMRDRLAFQNQYELGQIGARGTEQRKTYAAGTDEDIRKATAASDLDLKTAGPLARARSGGTLRGQLDVYKDDPTKLEELYDNQKRQPADKTPPTQEGYEAPQVIDTLGEIRAKKSGREYKIEAFNGKNYIHYKKQNETPRPDRPAVDTASPKRDERAVPSAEAAPRPVPSPAAAPPRPAAPPMPFVDDYGNTVPFGPSPAPVSPPPIAAAPVPAPQTLPNPEAAIPTAPAGPTPMVNPEAAARTPSKLKPWIELHPEPRTQEPLLDLSNRGVPDSAVPPEAAPPATPPGRPPYRGPMSYRQDQAAPDEAATTPVGYTPGNMPRGQGLVAESYDSARKAGFSHNGSIYMLGDVGRENGFQPQFMFGAHRDANNGEKNIGIFSWQKDRAIALEHRLRQAGLWDDQRDAPKVNKASLDAQWEFARDEMAKRNPLLLSYLQGEDVPQRTASRGMQRFLSWDAARFPHHAGVRDQYIQQSRQKIEQLINGRGQQRVEAQPTSNPDIYDVLVA